MCNICKQTGWVTTIDYVPYGSTSVPMETEEMCSCLDDNFCPQCDLELIVVCGENLKEFGSPACIKCDPDNHGLDCEEPLDTLYCISCRKVWEV